MTSSHCIRSTTVIGEISSFTSLPLSLSPSLPLSPPSPPSPPSNPTSTFHFPSPLQAICSSCMLADKKLSGDAVTLCPLCYEEKEVRHTHTHTHTHTHAHTHMWYFLDTCTCTFSNFVYVYSLTLLLMMFLFPCRSGRKVELGSSMHCQ